MEYLIPQWLAPANVKALVSYRVDDGSRYGRFNLADHVGDDAGRVETNRKQLLQDCDGLTSIQWLQQVHGVEVVDADQGAAAPVADGSLPIADGSLPIADGSSPAADGSFSRTKGRGCAVMTADCLPVLFCNAEGTQVAAAHAGWRGLATGILQKTLGCFQCPNDQIMVWLGPAISQPHFEIGPEVREQLLAAAPFGSEQAFIDSAKPGHYQADLYQLARLRLQQAGVTQISGGDRCSFSESRFYSYRRDGVTGRMVTLVYLSAT